MLKQEFIFKIIEIGLQIILVIFAGKALSVWKKEIRGRDKYNQAKSLLKHIEELRFLIHSKNGSMHQIYLNDILVNSNNFYRNQLLLVGKEKVYFDKSVLGLFGHINVRSDIFLPKGIRAILGELCPSSLKLIENDKNKETYIQILGVKIPKIGSLGEVQEKLNCIYLMDNTEKLTIEVYFRKWENLIRELQKIA